MISLGKIARGSVSFFSAECDVDANPKSALPGSMIAWTNPSSIILAETIKHPNFDLVDEFEA